MHMNMFCTSVITAPAFFLLRLKDGISIQYGIDLFPRMRLKRDVIFGISDLWGELLSDIAVLVSANLIVSLEEARIQRRGREG